MVEEKEEKKNEKLHFVCEINYAPNQDWRTDFTLGQKGVKPHGHMALSGATIWYLRDEQGNEIIKDDEIVLKKSIPESALWSEKSLAKNWMNKEEDEIWKDL
jgi:hypothetical protein